jgi:16S rRNA processing protein RimM
VTDSADPGWVTVARLGRPRGNRGEVTAIGLSSKPKRYASLREVFLVGGVGADRAPQRLTVESVWFHQRTLVFKFRGVDSITGAERLGGGEVRVPASERVPLEPGEFFQSDLVGCEVVDRRTGEGLGRVTGWEDGGGAGLLVLESGVLVPFARSICVVIDPAGRRIEVEFPEGLKELNRS